MARRNDHTKEELRELALNAAEALVAKEGLSGLSARKVAASIGYSAGSLYQLFASIDELCWELNSRTLSVLLQQLVESEQPCAAQEQLHAYALCYCEFAIRHTSSWSMLFEHKSSTCDALPVKLTAQIEDLFAQIERPLMHLNKSKTPKEVALAAKTLWSGVHGITTLAVNRKLFLSIDGAEIAMLDCLISSFLEGWCKEKPAC